MRPDTTPRRPRHLLLAAIAVLLCTSGLVAGFVEPAGAAAKPAKVKGVKLVKPRIDGATASFKVKWKRAARATSYKVKWRVPGGTAHTDRTRKTSKKLKGLAQGTSYCVKVRAYNGKRKGKWSKTRCRTTPQLDRVQPVWVDRQEHQGGTVALTFRWNEVAGATAYDLDYAPGPGDVQKDPARQTLRVGAGSGAAGVVVGGLQPNKVYCFQVRPHSGYGAGALGATGCKSTVPTSRAVGGPLKVSMMTWNVCSGDGDGSVCAPHPWDDRKVAAKSRIASAAPDAVALQESAPAVNDLATTTGYELACRVGDGYLKNPNNHPDRPLVAGTRNQSLIVRSAKFDVLTETANGYRFYGYTHGGCWVKVRDKVTNRELILASLHLVPPVSGSDQTRLDQAATFWGRLTADPETAGLPILLAGDFNSDRGSGLDGPREYLGTFGWDDSYDVAEQYASLPYLNSFNAWSSVPRIFPRWGGHIDRVFVPPSARVTSWRLDEPYANGRWSGILSDHSPVRVTVEIP